MWTGGGGGGDALDSFDLIYNNLGMFNLVTILGRVILHYLQSWRTSSALSKTLVLPPHI